MKVTSLKQWKKFSFNSKKSYKKTNNSSSYKTSISILWPGEGDHAEIDKIYHEMKLIHSNLSTILIVTHVQSQTIWLIGCTWMKHNPKKVEWYNRFFAV